MRKTLYCTNNKNVKTLIYILGLFLVTTTATPNNNATIEVLIIQDVDHHDVALQVNTYKNILITAFNYNHIRPKR